MNPLLWLCFTISGAAGLALEMLWMRSAGLVLGQTAVTTATVLACYFGGLGLGAAGARRVRHGAVRIYGWLEVGGAAGALWSVAVFRGLASDGAQRWLAASGSPGRIAAVAVAVLPATLCLGATLPALGEVLASGAVGGRGGWLYALNTLGGAAGIAVAGFGLPAAIGVRASYGVAAACSALAGTVALAAARWHSTDAHLARVSTFSQMPAAARHRGMKRRSQHVQAESLYHRVSLPNQSEFGGTGILPVPAREVLTQPLNSVSHRRLRIVAAGAGALGLGLEVLWTRLFAQVLHNSVYSFSAIAFVFLLAIAAGAAASALLLRRLEPASIATAALVGAALATVAGVWLFVWRTGGLAYVGMQSGLAEYVVRIVALAALCVGPAAFASGIVLPALWGAWGGHGGAARPLGDLSAANTFGGIAGALVSGFIGIPVLGVRGSLLAAGVAYTLLAHVLASPSSRWRLLAYAALCGVLIARPTRAPLVHLRSVGDGPNAETLHATAEGPNGIVSVVETNGDLQLRLDNYYVLGGSAAATNERRLGLVPLLLHPAPHRALFIGLATGITASAGPALGVDETTVVELVPEVAAAARTHFAAWNGNLLDRAGVRLVVDDGRRYVAGGREPLFDVIVSDLFIPWHAGAGSLYSREMYEAVARRLAPGGLFCQWLPLYQLTRDELDMIARTFLSVFPQVSLWRADFYPNRAVVGLVGQLNAQPVDLTRVGERLEQLPAWSRDPLLATPRGLVMLSAGPLTPVADLFSAAALNTDDRPLLEFNAPRLTRINAAGDKDWFTGESLATFYDTLAERTAAIPDPLLPASDAVADARRAGRLLYRYALAATINDTAAAARLEAEVRTLVPEVIRSAESSGDGSDLAEARRTLTSLRAEQEQVRQRLEELEQRLGHLPHAGEDRQ